MSDRFGLQCNEYLPKSDLRVEFPHTPKRIPTPGQGVGLLNISGVILNAAPYALAAASASRVRWETSLMTAWANAISAFVTIRPFSYIRSSAR